MKSKHPLITGALILTASGMITRCIGFLYKIFLSRTIGAEGIGLYQMIFPIYGVCYALTTAGFEIAISRFTAARASRQNFHSARRILWLGLSMSLLLCAFTCVLLYTQADRIALHILRDIRCADLLRIMALSIPCGACHSCISGYYYGLKKASVPAFSQLLEQTVRVVSVYLIYKVTSDAERALTPAAAVTGMVLGEAASMLFSFFFVSSEQPKADREADFSLRRCAGDILHMAAPVTANRVCLNLLGSAEAILIPLTLRQYGLSSESALSIYGTLTGMAMAFIMFPSVLTNAVSVMLLPVVSESQTLGQKEHLSRTIRRTVGACLILGTGCTIFFLLTGRFLGLFFFHSPLAGDFLITLAWICPFLYLNGTLHSVLNGLGKTNASFIDNLIGILVRIFFILLLIPSIGIEGYLYGLLVNQLLVALLSLLTLKEYLR